MNDPDNAEGVAGQTFVRRRTIPVSQLPEINAESSEKDLETYCRRAFVPYEWVKKRLNNKTPRAMPRSLLGIPVEVGGDPWGALVVDSRSEGEISRKSALNTARFKTLTNVLSKLLQSPKAHRK